MKDTSILIVEDDSNSAFVLKSILQKAGYDILPIASNGENAIQCIEENHPALILMDISLSGQMDGIETVQEIHKRYDIPIIYLTGHTSEAIIKRAKATTPYGFILKPYTTQMVLVTTEMAFHKALVEKESKEAKLRLSVTLGNLTSPVFSVLPNKLINYVNNAGIKFLNQPIGKILNKNIEDILPLVDADNKAEKVGLFSLQEEDFSKHIGRHVVYVDAVGKDRHIHLQVSVLKNIYNELQGYVVSLNDFTDQFYAEQNNQMLATSLENSQEGMLVVCSEDNFKILYANQCLLKIFQKNNDNIVDTSLVQFFCKNFNEDIIRALKGSCAYSADTKIVCEDYTEKITNWTLSPFGRDKIAITVRDVTQLRKLEENLRQSQKIEAIGRLASGIAHDFNNLLSVINGCTDLALGSLAESEKVKEYLQSVRNAGKQGAMLVQQLMMFSRKEQPQSVSKAEFSSVNTIRQSLDMLKNYLGKSISFSTYLEPSLRNIKIKPVQFDQVLVNLCVNAKDAMPNGGQITVNIENYVGCPEGLLQGNFAKIEVKDSGVGMSDEIQKKIFEPFFTTKPIGQGTGLGLASAYGIIKRSGGSIQVESALGEGTLFTVFVPQVPIEGENVSISTNVLHRKCCFLDVDANVSNFLIPFLKQEKWKICETKTEGVITISHDKRADVYIPREFCLESKIQHPLAAAQILKEIRSLA